MKNPWTELPEQPPYVLPPDREKLERHNASSPPGARFETRALPFPFMGKTDAPVVLLHLNPGLAKADLSQQETDAFRTRYRANLGHADLAHPCFLLDPALRAHPGHSYWRKHLSSMLEALGTAKLSRGLLILEWFPYASESAPARFPRLESQNYSFDLLRRSIAGKAVVIVLRARQRWEEAVPELLGYNSRFELNSPQAASVSPKNCPQGYDAALRRLA